MKKVTHTMKIKTCTVTFNSSETDNDGPPEPALEALAWWTEKINQVPEQFRAAATVELIRSDWNRPGVRISYERPETDEEEAQRLKTTEMWDRQKEARERAELIRLRAKYPTA